ncbi:rod shape-determining protein MreD [Gallaecimonas sp. GXIMD1310]|uniref:rod shape-determining protein MreD n=1 Tax=Gallaecimonas sp. GXIMD1310 TaxID=3131926 RepID=UPI003248BE08
MNAVVITLSLLVALVLALLPMPLPVDAFRPDWLLLVLVYWTMALPHRVSVGIAWLSGLLMDIMLGSTLGVHALAMTIAVYIAAVNFQRLRNFSVWQQALIIAVLVAVKLVLVYWVEHLANGVMLTARYFWPVLTSAVMWLWLFPLLRRVRRKFRVR